MKRDTRTPKPHPVEIYVYTAPDENGKQVFMLYWQSDEGTKAQNFNSHLQEIIRLWEEQGWTVIIKKNFQPG